MASWFLVNDPAPLPRLRRPPTFSEVWREVYPSVQEAIAERYFAPVGRVSVIEREATDE